MKIMIKSYKLIAVVVHLPLEPSPAGYERKWNSVVPG